MLVQFADPARREFDEAVNFYARIDRALGVRFVESARQSVQLLSGYPKAGRPVEDGIRSKRVPGFPYALLYEILPDSVRILAVMHHSRGPAHRTQIRQR